MQEGSTSRRFGVALATVPAQISALSKGELVSLLDRLSSLRSRASARAMRLMLLMLLSSLALALRLFEPRHDLVFQGMKLSDIESINLLLFLSIVVLSVLASFAMKANILLESSIEGICNYIDSKAGMLMALSYRGIDTDNFHRHLRKLHSSSETQLLTKHYKVFAATETISEMPLIPLIILPLAINVYFLTTDPFSTFSYPVFWKVAAWLLVTVQFTSQLSIGVFGTIHRRA